MFTVRALTPGDFGGVRRVDVCTQRVYHGEAWGASVLRCRRNA